MGLGITNEIQTKQTLQSIIIVLIEAIVVLNFLKYFTFSNASRLASFVVIWMVCMFIISIANGSERMLKNIIYTQFWTTSFMFSFVLIRIRDSFFNKSISLYTILTLWSFAFTFNVLQLKQFIINNEASNQIFYSLLILPWILLIKKNILRNLIFTILFILVLFSFKRSSITIILISIIYYVYYTYIRRKNNYTFLKYFLATIIVLGSIYAFTKIDNLTGNFITYRFTSVETDQGSGRLGIWENIYNLQMESSNIEWIFGHGHNTVVEYNYDYREGKKLSAHNDFLEVLFDYGILMFLLYVVLYFHLIRRLFYLHKIKHQFSSSYGVSIIIFVVMSNISHLIMYPTYFAFLTAYWGAIEAKLINDNATTKQLLM